MDFLGGLGNVFHAIGSFLTGGGGNAQTTNQPVKRPQQNQPQPQQQQAAPQLSVQAPQQAPNNTLQVVQPPQQQQPVLTLAPSTPVPAPQQQNPASTLVKANGGQQIDTSQFRGMLPDFPPPTASAPSDGGFWHDITHNPVTDLVGGAIKSVGDTGAHFGKNDIIDPFKETVDLVTGNQAAYNRDWANQNVDLGLSKRNPKTGQITGNDLGAGLEKLGGNTANLALTALAPGIDNLTEKAAAGTVGRFAPQLLTKAAGRALGGAIAGTGFGAANAMANDGDLSQVGQGAEGGAKAGAIVGGASPFLGALLRPVMSRIPGIGNLFKSNSTTDTAAPATALTKNSDEVAVGIKSVNPNQVPDAAFQVTQRVINDSAPVEADNMPAYLRKAPPTGPPQPTVETPLDNPAYLHQQAMKQIADQGDQELNDWFNQHQDATPQEIEKARATISQQVTEGITKLQNARYGAADLQPATQETGVPTAVQDTGQPATPAPQEAQTLQNTPFQPPEQTAPTQTPAPALVPANQPPLQSPISTGEIQPAQLPETQQPLQVSSQPPMANNVAQDANNVNPNGDIKNARFQQAVVDASKNPAMKMALEDAAQNKTTAPLAQLNETAIANVQNMSLPELVQHYGQDFTDKGPIDNPQQLYEHLQALKQLEQLPNDPTAQAAAANALRAINDYANRSGVGVRSMRLAYDDLPTSMKVAYLNKIVQKAGGDLNPADAEQLYKAADLQGQLAKTVQEASQTVNALAAKSGTPDPQFNVHMQTALAGERAAESELEQQNRVVVDILEKNLPKSDIGTRVAQDARTMMLSSAGGRGFAMIGTGMNAAGWAADNTLSSIYGRGINAINKVLPGERSSVRTSFANPSTLVKGAGAGFKDLAESTFGSAPVKNVDDYLKNPYDNEYSHNTTRYGKFGNWGPVRTARNLVQFATGSHMAATSGIEEATLEQAARQAAKDAGIPKENVAGFVQYYKDHPPTNVANEARQVWQGVNNLHTNRISNGLAKAASTLETIGGDMGPVGRFVGQQVRTVMLPFSHYMGGFVDKALTDRNVLYNAYRIAAARSPQELSDQLAHLTTNVGAGIGLGYLLAKNGTITFQDQNGKNYDGFYIKLGNKYVSGGILGQFAMPILMGAQLHQSLNDGSHGGSWPVQTFNNFLKTTGVAGAFGGNNNVITTLSGNSGPGLVKMGASAIQQHIPALSGDINAILNQTPLNPTHESANTKVTGINPTTGRSDTNYLQTAKNDILNQIPVVSQLALPRNTGQVAPTELDRIFHAGDASSTQMQNAANSAQSGNPEQLKAQLTADKTAFKQSNKDIATINGKTYINYKGNISSYDDPTKAQQALDYARFKDGNQNFQQINGMVYQRGSDGKTTAMEQKDYDYKNASDMMTSSQNSGDVTGYTNGGTSLLGNIGWQLQHANLTQENRDALIQKAVQTQEDLAKVNQYGGFTKPKGAASYATPTITGAYEYSPDQQKQYGGIKGYTEAIQAAGAKYGVDINALLSVAAQEGLGGGVGDNGTSFGPFQLHAGGALPADVWAKGPQYAQQWAESPAGIDYAVQTIKNIVGNKTGADAINAIVQNFEKPADPTTEAQNALTLYSGGKATLSNAGGVTSLTPGAGSSGGSGSKNLLKDNTIRSIPQLLRDNFTGQLTAKPINKQIYQVPLIPPSGLIKAHAISVRTAKGNYN